MCGAHGPESSITRLRAWLDRTGWRPAHYLLLVLFNEHLFASGTRAGGHDWRYIFYPWADALRLSIGHYHTFPWWNPWSIAGEPLFADPQAAVLVPDTLLLLVFGTVLGLKLVVFFYACVGYEGSRFLCRDLFGRTPFVTAVSVLPALLPPLALHWNEGHVVFVVFLLFPWLLALALTWQESTARALGLGVIVAWHFDSYLHYCVIMSLTIAGPVAALGFVRGARRRETWLRAALVLATTLGLSYLRLATALPFLASYPRVETSHYPIVMPLSGVLSALIAPLQDRDDPFSIAGLHWWELDTYVGVFVLGLAGASLRARPRTGLLLVGAAVLCLVLAWNNGAAPFPSYYLHRIRPWDHMVVITRWRFYAAFFFLVAAVNGARVVHRRHPRLAIFLALAAVVDVGLHYQYALRGTFTASAPPLDERDFDAPPVTVAHSDEATWEDARSNRVSLGARCPLLGYGYHIAARSHAGEPEYRGDFPGATVVSWGPDHVVLRGKPGATLTLNINPSVYWTMNGVRLFPDARELEMSLPFIVVVPPSGEMDLRASPPGLAHMVEIQAAFALLAAALALLSFRRGRRQPEVTPATPDATPSSRASRWS
jgi:hypothetical protein